MVHLQHDGLVCLINVYMPARGSPDCDMQFQSTLDEIHEILEKYGQTHKIILGGDFNASLHRTPPLGRDRVLQTFLAEHNLYLPDNYPSQYTYFHEGTDAKSQIHYWFISPLDQETVEVGKKGPGKPFRSCRSLPLYSNIL